MIELVCCCAARWREKGKKKKRGREGGKKKKKRSEGSAKRRLALAARYTLHGAAWEWMAQYGGSYSGLE